MTTEPIAGLAWRETRRGGLIVVASLAAIVAVFGAAYAGAEVASQGQGSFGTFAGNPTVRTLYGVPYALDTRGGFVVWRCTLMIPLLVTLWGALTATQVLRGDEDAGRWDLLLAQPARRTDATMSYVAVLSLWCVVIGTAIAVSLVAGGDPSKGSVLYGAAIGLLALTFVAVGMVAAQVFGNRRLAAGASGALIGGAMLVRMVADSSADREWLRWLTPFGWVENVKPFAADDAAPLILLVIAPALLVCLAMVLEHWRDLGEGLIRTSETASPKTLLLRDPARFAWRQRLGGLAGWSAGMVFYGLVIGAITAAGVTFVASNPQIEQAIAQFGFTGLSTPQGFVAACTPLVAVALTFYGASSLGHCFEDEEAGRLDLPYANPVTRASWLGAQVAAAASAVVVAAIVSIAATWIGGVAGDAGLGIGDITVATCNMLPATALFFGLAVLLLGVRPHLAVSVSAGAAIALYVMSFVGPALEWPQWVLDLNPFLQLGNAPVASVNWTAIAVLLGLSAIASTAGFATYRVRDLA